MNKELSYLVISDIHIGHRVNEADNIYNNFKYFIKEYKNILYHPKDNKDGVKIIFIAGDLFDRFLPSYSYEFSIGYKLLTDLLEICKDRNIKLRVLEGTPLHDWGQARLFNDMIKELKIDIDFRYISKLEIEKMEDLGIDILYIPDEVNHDSSKTYKQVKSLLKKEGIEEVDICIMHGAFQYQIPMFKSESFHKEEDYESIVRYNIHPGHVHKYSVRGKIIAQGSFDRLAHNEEEDKGVVLNTLDLINKSSTHTFLKNKHAMVFKSIDVKNLDIKSIVKVIKDTIRVTKKGSAIRIITEDKEKVKSAIEAFDITMEKDYKIKIKVDDGEKGNVRDVVTDNVEEIGVVSLSKDNLFTEISSHQDYLNLTSDLKHKVNDILKNLGIDINT